MYTIRPAQISDFETLYTIGTNTPELQVSAIEEFMDADEFAWAIESEGSVFLVAEIEEKIVGYIYAHPKDLDRPFSHKYACLIYLVVIPEYRQHGIAQKLYDECVTRLKAQGITHIYTWANAESEKGEMIHFMQKQGFVLGHKYAWMDKEL